MTKGEWAFLDVELVQVNVRKTVEKKKNRKPISIFLIFFFLWNLPVEFDHSTRRFQGAYWGEHGWATGDGEDGAARKAYEALLRVSLLKPTSTQFQNFSKLVRLKALENYNYTLSENEEVTILT